MNLNWIRFRRPVKSPASNGWLSCPSTIPTPLLPLLSCLYLHLSSLYSSFFCVLTFLLPPTHPPPLALCVVLVVSNLLIDIRCHKRRQFQSSVEPLLSLIERTGRWRGSIDSTDWGKRERDKEIEQRKRDTERGKNGGSLFGRCVSTKRCHFHAWPVDGQMEEERECLNNKVERVDFLPLPQLIKDPMCWVWQERKWAEGEQE